ncbi:hypothetical protein CBS101457_001225 [Exobasidium rhododendri]|nr:hypothetical protein CBS101457_001225 [Exobasidium rhododendri]
MESVLQRPVASASLTSEESLTAPSDEPSDSIYPHSLPTFISVRSARGLRNEQDRRFAFEASTSPTVSCSPCLADSTGGSASDYEHEPDSPSSLSSWNSWAGGRKGNLEDVDDLELDGGAGGEPELETVSEMDEESSSFCSSSDRTNLDSDEDLKHQRMGLLGLNYETSTHRQKNIRVGGQFNDVSNNHHVHHASNQHHYHHSSGQQPPTGLHAPPSFPHFSPRAGGHGLSHVSRYSLRAPPNLAARRRKGRIAELAEEGGAAAEPINVIPMPKKIPKQKGSKGLEKGEEEDAETTIGGGDLTANEDDVHPSQTETENERDEMEATRSPSTPTPYSTGHSWNDFEFIGPPAIPIRCVSPSETVPVISSPLCVCLNAEEPVATAEERIDTNAAEDVRAGDKIATPEVDKQSSSPTPTSPDAFRASTPAVLSKLATTSSGSSDLSRKTSRGRRASSPTRIKPKVPLRPCFRKKTSAYTGTYKKVESSSECESNSESSPLRGRNKVRFSEAPPMEVRAHSPVEYDRKACPISNRLSPMDVEELREMKMELGILEAKWAASAACIGKSTTEDEESEGENFYHPSNPPHLLTPPSPSPSTGRKRADSISSSSPSQFCKNRFTSETASSISPADHLRMEREKERERACRMAGIGTGIGFRYSGSGGTSPRQLRNGGLKTPGACNSSLMISRFGLSKPPPPLPGANPSSSTVPDYEDSLSLSKADNAMLLPSNSVDDRSEQQEASRGRTMDKVAARSVNDSTSTDGTVTELSPSSVSQNTPALIHTSPSPDSSPDGSKSSSSASPLPVHQQAYMSNRPSVRPYQLHPLDRHTTTPSHSPPASFADISSYCNGASGYDSPASEFYESGSEYDLIG